MRLLAFIISIGWIIFLCYWLVTALQSKRTASFNVKQFVGTRASMVIVLVIVVSFVNRIPASVRNRPLGVGGIERGLGLVIFLCGAALAIWARTYLGTNWGMPITQKEDAELVTSGPYHYIRHPIYAGFLVMALGSAITVNFYWTIVFIVAAVYFAYSAHAEEKIMGRLFPAAYQQYKKHSRMFIPYIL